MSLFLESMPTVNPVRPEPVEGRNGAQNKVWQAQPVVRQCLNPEHGQKFAALSMSFQIAKN